MSNTYHLQGEDFYVILCPADHLRYQTLSYTNQPLFYRNYLSGHDITDKIALPTSWGKLYKKLQIMMRWVTARIKSY
jgi:hypothetical protein